MIRSLFASDLHGDLTRYRKLFDAIERRRPAAVFLAGDLFPHAIRGVTAPELRGRSFLEAVLADGLRGLRERMAEAYPAVFVILGNDDGRFEEPALMDLGVQGLLRYAHDRRIRFHDYRVYGYAYVPPTPFRLKDWERYDVSRYVDPGCISPEEGAHSHPVSPHELRYATIEKDLAALTGVDPLDRAVFLFHSPPYQTGLDRADLDGKTVDHAPVDVHIGSIAIRRMIEQRQPWLTLHGHVHESARLTGKWRDRIERTRMLNAAHDGPELALIEFDLDDPSDARRELL